MAPQIAFSACASPSYGGMSPTGIALSTSNIAVPLRDTHETIGIRSSFEPTSGKFTSSLLIKSGDWDDLQSP